MQDVEFRTGYWELTLCIYKPPSPPSYHRHTECSHSERMVSLLALALAFDFKCKIKHNHREVGGRCQCLEVVLSSQLRKIPLQSHYSGYKIQSWICDSTYIYIYLQTFLSESCFYSNSSIILYLDGFLLLQLSWESQSCNAATQASLVLLSVPHTILCYRPYGLRIFRK